MASIFEKCLQRFHRPSDHVLRHVAAGVA
jgi:hypothetical protein